MANDALRDELIGNEDARAQSQELLETITVSRVCKGYPPRETGVFLFSLKEALLKALNEEIPGDPKSLNEESLKISNDIDSLAILTFETYIKGRAEVILPQTDEIAEITI